MTIPDPATIGPARIDYVHTAWGEASDIKLGIVREDLLSALAPGPKYRKLIGWLDTHRPAPGTRLIGYGGTRSNHLLGLAREGEAFGYPTAGLVLGDKPALSSPILDGCLASGMQLAYTGYAKPLFFDDHSTVLISFAQALGGPFALVGDGGAGEAGVVACAYIVDMYENEEVPHWLFCSAGTGAMAAGIVRGLAALADKGNPVPKLGVMLPFDKGTYMEQRIRDMAGRQVDFMLFTQFGYGRFGQVKPQVRVFAQAFYVETGIALDAAYSAKMMLGIATLAAQGFFAQGSTVHAIHCGGAEENRIL